MIDGISIRYPVAGGRGEGESSRLIFKTTVRGGKGEYEVFCLR